VSEEVTQAGVKVRVVPLTSETALAANRIPYAPRPLPAEITQFISSQPDRSGGAARYTLPPAPAAQPYSIGVGDVLLLSVPTAASTVEQLSGLLAAQNSRQGYTVQDDGTISIPTVGRVRVADMTMEQAESALFRRFVEAGVEPTFTVEIAEFRSKKVEVGGAVGAPTVIPVALGQLSLNEAILTAGGLAVQDPEFASIQLFRDGKSYEVPAVALYQSPALQEYPLAEGDRIVVRTTRDPARMRGDVDERRAIFASQLELDAVDRDYVYLTGEVAKQSRIALPFERRASLADVLFGEGGYSTRAGNPRHIYVLRGSSNPADFGGLTAYQLDAENAGNLLVATRFEMRPNDIVFVAEQPVTRWNRAVSLAIPALVVSAATN
jgi:polysaccharide export outer membrane protein